MPSHEKHCQDSLRKYGKRLDDMHYWMDEPSDIRGREHRMFRHDPETTPQEARKLFGEFADHACLDHIRLDQKYSDEIKRRTMDTGFCQRWDGDEKSKYCRQCIHPGHPCYELWQRVCQLAAKRLEFTNNRKGKAFGNRYRIESPSGKICYLQMLQGARSRFPLPIEDFLYVTITGKGGVNETPSGTRQYPFVDLLLEIIASGPEGESLIVQVRSPDARAEMGGPPNPDDLPDGWDWRTDEELLGSDDSHFYQSMRSTAERVKTAEKNAESEKPLSGEDGPSTPQDQLLHKRSNDAPVVFAILFYTAYLVLCVLTIGVLITGSALAVSAIAVGIGLTTQRKSSRIDHAASVLLFLLCFLVLTVFFLEGVPFSYRFLIFLVGLASTFIIVRRMLRGP